ncbi:uncharacterized protein LAJ45_05408 [Morchella importuna]|uniref:uncharacterized protein n=1 Tax=Morchella importuna TaxID=1174673 RepID=UPI001E8D7430|nr:uncharacterized protein LAJ45_05408 [Morchella importuna]KAH8150712.1 hypothetical protein LAJ45_05408 [Morchella importuna]
MSESRHNLLSEAPPIPSSRFLRMPIGFSLTPRRELHIGHSQPSATRYPCSLFHRNNVLEATPRVCFTRCLLPITTTKSTATNSTTTTRMCILRPSSIDTRASMEP